MLSPNAAILIAEKEKLNIKYFIVYILNSRLKPGQLVWLDKWNCYKPAAGLNAYQNRSQYSNKNSVYTGTDIYNVSDDREERL